MKKIALISAILENPTLSQQRFNEIVSHYKGIIRGRIGLPLDDADIAVIALSAIGKKEDIDNFTEELSALPHVILSTVYAKKELTES